MRWLAAGLTFVNAATVSALLSGMIGHGLNRPIAVCSVFAGLVAAHFAFWCTYDSPGREEPRDPGSSPTDSSLTAAWAKYRVWLWFLVAIFAIFAFRCFCWILFADGNELKVQSPNNLGDLSLHLTYIRNFASGVPLWPENPIYVFSHLRYPAGTDFFNAILACLGCDVTRGLVWTGLLACAATCYAFYRWGGCFGIAGFLFNGGIVGFQALRTLEVLDYQDVPNIAWKSIPLTMLLTQRGLLYALPAGLLLLWHWRAKFYPKDGEPNESLTRAPLPFWLELSLYATMPLFHAHTFLALSIVLAVLFLFGTAKARGQIAWLVGCAFIPAGLIAWLITDHFHAGSVLAFNPGWVQNDGEFARPFSHSTANFGILNSFVTFLEFWIVNFGLWIPIVLALAGSILFRAFGMETPRDGRRLESLAFLVAATLIFLLAFFVKTAPWGWDNIKILVWAYFIILPFLWSELLSTWSLAMRAGIYVALFGSGFVSLFGGMAAGRTGFGIADRAEVDVVGFATSKLPAQARYAAFPTYNHPLLLQGRKLVLGYPGHLWTQGFEYQANYDKFATLMQGAANWKETARFFHARYLFWGREEKTNYPQSKRPWEQESKLVVGGSWGAIYDLEAPGNSDVRPVPASRGQ
ncbi:MAG: hypothetical protein QOE34_1542 [Verrucomicrobiota bacterium]|jgi:hypothetical protein